ncbi:hypothetical protein [Bradyrhizobium sp. USDA 10063]
MKIDPMDPFNTGAWIQRYAALQEQQRARQDSGSAPADEASPEQQLSDFQLSCSGLSSAAANSPAAPLPDTRSERGHRRIQLDDIGGSNRTSSQSKLRDDVFGSARHGVDLPRGHSAAGTPLSDLHDWLFGGTRHIASEAQPAVRTKDNKSRGFWPRVRSGVAKVFGCSHRETSSRDSVCDVVNSEFRMYYAKRGRVAQEDEALLSEFSNMMSEFGNRDPDNDDASGTNWGPLQSYHSEEIQCEKRRLRRKRTFTRLIS